MTGYGLDDRSSITGRNRGFAIRHDVQTSSGFLPSFMQWIPNVPSPELKRLKREADYSYASSAEIKNAWIFASSILYVFMARSLSKEARSNICLIFI